MNDNKYQNGKIYRLFCKTTRQQYYGSTTNKTLSTRLSIHKCDYKRFLEGKRGFVSSFEILKNDNYQIILVENYPCVNKKELHKRERYYIENNECVNMMIPCRTPAEYRLDNVEKEKERHKKYYEENIDKFKEYYKENFDKIKSSKRLQFIKKMLKLKLLFKDS